MQGIAVSLIAQDKDRLAILQHRLETSNVAHIVFSSMSLPNSATDPVLRRIQDVGTEVVLLDIPPGSSQAAITTIELVQNNSNEIVIFAVGEMNNPSLIISAMRAGAREFVESNVSTESLTEAFTRFATSRGKTRSRTGKARVFTIINAKGGAGSTTVAVNTAIALQELQGDTLLVDFAPLAHSSLHLNVRPLFGITDALQNLHRLDSSLLDGLITTCKGGLRLLAGSQYPHSINPTASELTMLFEQLVTHFRYVVVDCSGRVDQTARLLCDLSDATLLVTQSDVVSFWSAGRMRTFLEEGAARGRVRLVLNRYKKIPGFTDEDVEKATNCSLLCKLPNNYQSVAPAINKGVPVVLQENQDISKAFRSLANTLTAASASADESLEFSSQESTSNSNKKQVGRLLISPLRAGH
ncbi:MAG: AAA family ATPase [Terriglobales bacterium]